MYTEIALLSNAHDKEVNNYAIRYLYANYAIF